MDAIAVLQQVFRIQNAFVVLGAVLTTVYLFPKQAVVSDFEEFDAIVVGGGSAGIVVAFRLAECFKVLLIEAGKDPPLQSLTPGLYPYLAHTEVDWNYTDSQALGCHRQKTLNLTIGHVLGGGSSINYMYYVRGCPGDYRSWADAANDSSWDYESLLPLFIKSERLEDEKILSSPYRKYHGTDGFLGVTRQHKPETGKFFESFKELGYDVLLDINGERSLGYTDQLLTIANGVRQSTAYSILAKYKIANLKVLRETFVTKILFDENNNAIGVRATTKDNKQITFRASKEVIVSAGALNTPRLLMLSGIGPKEHLETLKIPVKIDLPVGKNLQDHVNFPIAIKLEESNEPPPPTNPFAFPATAFTGYVALNKSQECPTYQSINFAAPAGSQSPVTMFVFNNNFRYDISQSLSDVIKNRNILYTTMCLLHPESRGEVLLRSTNPRDPPLIDVGYLKDDRDLEALVDSGLDFVRVLNTTYFRSVNASMVNLRLRKCEGLPYMSREWWRCYVRCLVLTIYHYSGTCALGAVVDGRLRVRGAGRLRVVDASVMPRLVGGNLNAPVIAIAEKAADIIKKDHLCFQLNMIQNSYKCKS